MKSSKKIFLIVVVALVVAALAAGVFYYLEWEKPQITLDKTFEIIGKQKEVVITLRDKRSGIRDYKVALVQGGQEHVAAAAEFPARGTNEQVVTVKIVPKDLGVKEGAAVFSIKAADFSLLHNTTVLETEITVDSVPPIISLLSGAHNINPGGVCLALYRVNKAVAKSGVKCGGEFFSGHLVEGKGNPYYVCYFAIPREVTKETAMAIFVADQAGNEAAEGIPFYIRSVKPFRSDAVNISDNFMQKKSVEFQTEFPELAGKTQVEVFKYVNTELRAENDAKIHSVCTKTDSKQLWEGTFLRMKDSAPMALFGDQRTYLYEGNTLGTSIHLGVDLASLALSPVEATNSGTVLFAGKLGIYGNGIIIDHGQGITSLYGHLSSINVKEGQGVAKGETIGISGATGFAGGDHLHFSILVDGIFVDPKEWWDPHWIKDNVTSKLEGVDAE